MTVVQRCCWYCASFVLVLTNSVMLLPDRWTFLQFCPIVVAPAAITLETNAAGPQSLLLEDLNNTLALYKPAFGSDQPLPFRPLERALQRRRIEHFIAIVSIALDIGRSDSPLMTRTYDPSTRLWQEVPAATTTTTTFNAAAVWQPMKHSRIRFVLPVPALSPGEYRARARLFAPPRWTSDAAVTANDSALRQLPAWPGSVLVLESISNETAFVVGQSE